ncbi:MAG TPA: TetR/AcrR family transcriptional regulator [Ktedonobacteraceae bacterium]|jgi:AcrR family transcriptional regulator|nr:TetR/AcrR family transcriptional regulator [Ktedonobacteraceae bacterium]
MMQPVTAHRSLKEKQRQEREELILQEAEKVLMEKGYYETSIDEIAARVGIAKGTVYLHFPSKEDLVVAIFQRDMERLLQLIKTTLASSSLTPRAKAEVILEQLYGSLFTRRMQLFYSITNFAELKQNILERKACVRDLWEEIGADMTTLFEEGKAAGEFDSSIPTAVMLSTFFSFMSPRSYSRLLNEEHIPANELAKHLARIYFKGITV